MRFGNNRNLEGKEEWAGLIDGLLALPNKKSNLMTTKKASSRQPIDPNIKETVKLEFSGWPTKLNLIFEIE